MVRSSCWSWADTRRWTSASCEISNFARGLPSLIDIAGVTPRRVPAEPRSSSPGLPCRISRSNTAGTGTATPLAIHIRRRLSARQRACGVCSVGGAERARRGLLGVLRHLCAAPADETLLSRARRRVRARLGAERCGPRRTARLRCTHMPVWRSYPGPVDDALGRARADLGGARGAPREGRGVSGGRSARHRVQGGYHHRRWI